ncbi:MAG: LacI family DNA-binding transcriptional regulator [Candidatus Omnitrophota bacterium]
MASTSFKEIGKKLKISRFTVARVLRGEKYVSEKTRALVLDHLKKEPYVPNVHSSVLFSGKVKILGLVFLGEAFFSMEFYIQEIIKGVSEVAKKEGYQLMLFTQEQFNSSDCQRLYLSKQVAGFILPSIGKDNFKDIIELKDKKIPLVLLCSHLKNVPSFDCDNVTGGYLAAKYLLDSGRKRIAFLHGNENWVDAEDRFQGYKKALKEAGKEIGKGYVQYNSGYTYGDYEKAATKRLLGLKEPPDAIFAVNDRMALAVMSAVKEEGKSIPRDIAVVGFDNIPSCESFSPALTSVAQPVNGMAVAATRALIRAVSSGKNGDRTQFFKPNLVIRKSA